MKQPSTIAAVVFDVGGVLSADMFAELSVIDRDCGLPDGTLQRYFRTGADFAEVETGRLDIRTFFRKLDASIRAEHGVDIDIARVVSAGNSAMKTRPGMVEWACDLADAGVQIALLTNMIRESRQWLAHLLPEGVVSVVVDSSAVGLRKPDPQIYRHLLDRLQLPADQVVYFDDQEENLPPARDLGINAYLFTSPESAKAALAAHPGPHQHRRARA